MDESVDIIHSLRKCPSGQAHIVAKQSDAKYLAEHVAQLEIPLRQTYARDLGTPLLSYTWRRPAKSSSLLLLAHLPLTAKLPRRLLRRHPAKARCLLHLRLAAREPTGRALLPAKSGSRPSKRVLRRCLRGRRAQRPAKSALSAPGSLLRTKRVLLLLRLRSV